MHSEKIKYEKLIVESPLFELDKKTHSTAYRAEAYRMKEYLYQYLMAVNAKKYEDCGLEITEIATRCIQNFDGEKGEFLHYFNAAWKKEFSRILMKKSEEDKFHGMHFLEEQRRKLRRVLRFAKTRGIEIDSPDYIDNLVEYIGLSKDEVMEVVELYNVNIISDSGSNEDGEDFNIIDLFKSSDSAEESIIQTDKCIEFLKNIDEVYSSLQERQQPMLSDVFTIKLCEVIVEMNISFDEIKFLNTEIIAEYKKTGRVISQRDLALKYGRDEASISRTIKEFIKKLEVVKEL